MPAPRSILAVKVSVISLHPETAARRAADFRPRKTQRMTTEQNRRSAAFARKTFAMLSIALPATFAGGGTARGFAMSLAGSHWQSLGTISVATLPGGVSDAAIASAISPASARA